MLERRLVTGIDYEHRKEDAIFWYNGELSDFGSFPNFYKRPWYLRARRI